MTDISAYPGYDNSHFSSNDIDLRRCRTKSICFQYFKGFKLIELPLST